MTNFNSDKLFFKFAAGTLILTALAKLYSCTGTARVLQLQDQLLHLGYRPLMIIAALVELTIATLLLKYPSNLKRCLLLLWLCSNFLFYHWGNYILGVHLCSCLGHLTDKLPLPQGLAEVLLQFLVLYWSLTSLNMLWRIWGCEKWDRLLISGTKVVRGPTPRAN